MTCLPSTTSCHVTKWSHMTHHIKDHVPEPVTIAEWKPVRYVDFCVWIRHWKHIYSESQVWTYIVKDRSTVFQHICFLFTTSLTRYGCSSVLNDARDPGHLHVFLGTFRSPLPPSGLYFKHIHYLFGPAHGIYSQKILNYTRFMYLLYQKTIFISWEPFTSTLSGHILIS